MITLHEIPIYALSPKTLSSRYNWRKNHKIYMGNILANCFRLFVDDNMSNNDMQIGILEMLDQVIQDHVPEKWYVDRQAFDTIHPYINYKSIIDNQQNNGEYL